MDTFIKTVKSNIIFSEKLHADCKYKYHNYGCTSMSHLVRAALAYYMSNYKSCKQLHDRRKINDKIKETFIGKSDQKKLKKQTQR